jgi:hypothetical protein
MQYGEWFFSCLKHSFNRWESKEGSWNIAAPVWLTVLNWGLAIAGLYGVQKAWSQNQPAWFLALIPTAALFLFVTPFQLWRVENNEKLGLVERLRPRIAVTGVVVQQDGNKIVCLRVQKMGDGDPLRGCVGHLRGVCLEKDGQLCSMAEHVPTAYCRWSARFQQPDTHNPKLDILTEADLNVAVFDQIYFGRFTVPIIGGPKQIPALDEAPSYIFDVAVSAENAVTRKARMRLTINPIGIRSRQDSSGVPIACKLPDLKFEEIVDKPRRSVLL